MFIVKMLQFLLRIPYILPLFLVPYVLFLKVKKYVQKDMLLNRRAVLDSTSPILDSKPPFIIGYFHPYCNDGGGGERVLWSIIYAFQQKHVNFIHAIYTGDVDITKEELIEKVKYKFGLNINPDMIYLVYLNRRKLVDAKYYPRFTMMLQSLGSMLLGWEAITKLIPDLYFDTMGYAFTYPLVHYLADCKVVSYVHYPTISTDMLDSVIQGDDQVVNNSNFIRNSALLSKLKIMYYKLFAKAYGWTGSFSDLVMVNSTWTKGHIDSLWSMDSQILYPPCDTSQFNKFEIKNREPNLISIAQYRPEKNQQLQILAIDELKRTHPEYFNNRWGNNRSKIQVNIIGSVRNDEDQERFNRLEQLVEEYQLGDVINMRKNLEFDELKQLLSRSIIGLHTMKMEHFGINVVELMASGLFTIAHNSGGPKMDILKVKNDKGEACYGHLGSTAIEYSEYIHEALREYDQNNEQFKIKQTKNQEISNFFSYEKFESKLIETFDRFF